MQIKSFTAVQSLPGRIYNAGLSVGQVKEVGTGNSTIITIPNGQAIFSYNSAALYLNNLKVSAVANAIPGSSIEIVGNFNEFDLLLNSTRNTTIEILGNSNNITLNNGRVNLIITGNLNRLDTINTTIIKRNISGIRNNVTSNQSV